MMRISRKCEYALRAVFELAAHADGHPVKIHRIAGAQNIPPRFLEVILNELRHAGIVSSRRGNSGGYMLGRAAQEVTVGDVVEYLHGPIAPRRAEDNRRAYSYGDYAFGEFWGNVTAAMSNICSSTSFAELVECERQITGAGVSDYVI